MRDDFPGTSDAPGIHHLQRRVLAVLAIGQILGGVGIGAAVSLGSLLVADIAGSDAYAGLAATMVTIGAAVFGVPLARLAGRAGRRPALALGALCAAAGAVIVVIAAIADSFPLLLVGFGILGAGTAVNLQTRFAAVDLSTARHRGRDLSLVIWATTVGVVLGPNLAPPGDTLGRMVGLPPLTGAFALAVACQVAAAGAYFVLLRPDPLRLVAGTKKTDTPPAVLRGRGAVAILRRNRPASVAVVAVALSHATMVAIMAMTPVHLANAGVSITVIGLTISLHTAGMYALSPLFGAASDRVGRRSVVVAGQVLFVAALVINAAAGSSPVAVAISLILLGLGWSASTIAGSALLTESVAVAERTTVQGLSDSVMNLCGAAGGAVAGVVLAAGGYGFLNTVALVLVALVLVLLAVARNRPIRVPSGSSIDGPRQEVQ